tara:strand:- start:254 stop:556 length:303 start_codon:yes stop_codon:yes gene_type:complete
MKKTYQMYFGRNTPNGYVTDQQWDSFQDIISMSFAGYTVQDVDGAWKGDPERTKLVTVNTKYQDKVQDVCDAYISAFNQDAVGLRVSEPMRFVTRVCEVA